MKLKSPISPLNLMAETHNVPKNSHVYTMFRYYVLIAMLLLLFHHCIYLAM
jgi:hypothetical protein